MKCFVARQQCKRNSFLRLHGNIQRFILLTATCKPTTIQSKALLCFRSNNGEAKAPRCYVDRTLGVFKCVHHHVVHRGWQQLKNDRSVQYTEPDIERLSLRSLNFYQFKRISCIKIWYDIFVDAAMISHSCLWSVPEGLLKCSSWDFLPVLT